MRAEWEHFENEMQAFEQNLSRSQRRVQEVMEQYELQKIERLNRILNFCEGKINE